MRLKSLLREAGLPASAVDLEITGVTADSRRVREGFLFVAVSGARTDGFRHIEEAVKRGAVFAVSERPTPDLPHLAVTDARRALAFLCDAWYGHPAKGMALVGITGTNGKTSTAEMLCHILRTAGVSCGVIGTLSATLNGREIHIRNCDPLANMTTPEPEELYAILSEMRARGAAMVVMEVTSHALVQGRVAPLRFSRALFTNLTPEHLDFHGDMEAYYQAKKVLFHQCERAVVSVTSSYGNRLLKELDAPGLAVMPQDVGVYDGITRCRLTAEECNLTLTVPVSGAVFAENAALAAATALSFGMEATRIEEALRYFPGVRGRMEPVTVSGTDIQVFLDYAHTPDALERLLCGVRRWRPTGARIIAVFGCGGDRDKSKRKEMGSIATRLADLTVLTSDNSRSEKPSEILRDILKGVDKEKAYAVIEDRETAIRFAVETAAPGDIVLLAGKGHECYELRDGKRLPFSEREIVLAALQERKRRCDNAH